jgi:hypothetical protein
MVWILHYYALHCIAKEICHGTSIDHAIARRFGRQAGAIGQTLKAQTL